MKVLLINPISSGGITQYTICLANELQKYTDLLMLTSKDIDREYKKFFELNKYKELSKKTLYKLIFPKKTNKLSKIIIYIYNFFVILNIVKSENIDVIHFQWPLSIKLDKYLIKTLHKMNKKVVFTAHNVMSHEKTDIDYAEYKNMFDAYDNIIVHAECNKKDISNLFNIEENKISVIPHGNYFFINDFNKYIDREEAIKNLSLDPDNFYLLFFGYIRDYKGLDILIDSLKHLNERIHIIIAGSSDDFSKYDLMIKNLNLENRVHKFIEYLDFKDFGKYFYASDVAVFPYRNIYQSGAVQMAIAFKKPIIVSSVGGLTETIKDQYNGLVFEKENIDDLAVKINTLYNDNYLRNKISENGYNNAKTVLDWDKIAQNTFALYTK